MIYHLAIDIGASSGRHILAHLENGKIITEEVYRFENSLIKKGKHICWDTDAIFKSITAGIKKCAEIGKIPQTVGIDTWGLDFVLLDEYGRLTAETVAYRDHRTDRMFAKQEELVDDKLLYSRTGIQKQKFNSLYHLLAIKEEAPSSLEKADRLLMIPDYFNYLLTGVMKNEYTNATTTGLINAESCAWDYDLIEKLELPKRIFKEITMPGTVCGELKKEIADEVGFSTTVMLPATHDTGSAYIAVPAVNDTSVYISSGTWSLLGVENDMPITGEASRKANFTNEGGYLRKYRYLKNIMGLWMIQSIRRDNNKKFSYAELEQIAKACEDYNTIIDVDDTAFLAPECMTDAIHDYCIAHSLRAPSSLGETMKCVYISLAESYAKSIRQLSEITGKKYTTINIVGGGSKDTYLNHLTSTACGIPVYAGPMEGTAIGNLILQFIFSGELDSIDAGRKVIRNSFDIIKYEKVML